MRGSLCSVIVTLFTFISSTLALNILGISTLPSPSHHIWFTAFMNGLARNGHQIFTLSLQTTEFDKEFVKENQTASIVFDDWMERFQEDGAFDTEEWVRMSPADATWAIYQASHEFCKMQMTTRGAKQALELVKTTKIDVIVQDVSVGQCFYGLKEIALGNPPLVGFTPFGSPSWVTDIVGGNDWPAIKAYHIFPHVPPLTLWKKTLNLMYYEISNILRQYYYMPIQQKLAEKFIGKKLSTSLDKIEKNISVMLTNSYPALDSAIFLPPNAIEVGGLHVRNPKPLPEDIKEFLDGAEHGAIVISLGTNVKTSVFGPEKLKAIMAALGQLKQRVLWKFDADHLDNKPPNVMIKKWLPQGDILAHPKVRVLWSHSGLLSTQEAVWRGIPVLGMPFYLDQYANIDLIVRKGAGLRLDLEFLTTETILKILGRLLNDPSFALRMKQLSHEYRDRPMSPIELAIWHVEYAARHPGAPLASPGRDLSRWQLNLFDVYAVLGICIVSIFWIFSLLLRNLLKLFHPQGIPETIEKLKRK